MNFKRIGSFAALFCSDVIKGLQRMKLHTHAHLYTLASSLKRFITKHNVNVSAFCFYGQSRLKYVNREVDIFGFRGISYVQTLIVPRG